MRCNVGARARLVEGVHTHRRGKVSTQSANASATAAIYARVRGRTRWGHRVTRTNEARAVARWDDGLSVAIDAAAARTPAAHAFLRRAWFAAAVRAYGGARPRTLVVEDATGPALALPLVAAGPRLLRAAQVPGSYWPFRSFPAAEAADAAVFDAAVAALARRVRVLRIGPVYHHDAAAEGLAQAARAAGWAVLDRVTGHSFVFDLAGAQADGGWPRTSTLQQNRRKERRLAEVGACSWEALGGDDWPACFDALAAVETASWVGATGGDAKFTAAGHRAFWQAAASDPALRAMFRAMLLRVGGRAAAFTFDLSADGVAYIIANSFDPAFGDHSAGRLTTYRHMADAAGRGVAAIDWGSGDTGYKQIAGATPAGVLVDRLMIAPRWARVAGAVLRRRWCGEAEEALSRT